MSGDVVLRFRYDHMHFQYIRVIAQFISAYETDSIALRAVYFVTKRPERISSWNVTKKNE